MTEGDGTAGAARRIVVAGGGYAGLHVVQRLGSWARRRGDIELTLVDSRPFHQLVTELPRVATGTRDPEEVLVPLDRLVGSTVRCIEATVTGFDLPHCRLETDHGPVGYDWLVLALGSAPNDFDIPGLSEQVLYPYSAEDSERVWNAVTDNVRQAAHVQDREEQQRLMTVVIGGGGATGVELAGAFAEEIPQLAREVGGSADLTRVVLVEAGHTILAGSSPQLIDRATTTLHNLHVELHLNSQIESAGPEGFHLKGGQVISGGVYIWAGGVKAPALTRGSGLEVGYNGRIKVDRYLRALDHPNIFVAGDLASVVDPDTGRALPPLAQTAIEEGDLVARNLRAVLSGEALRPFVLDDKGFVVSIGRRGGAAEVKGVNFGGRAARALKDAIEWEYRQSVKHLRGWGA